MFETIAVKNKKSQLEQYKADVRHRPYNEGIESLWTAVYEDC